MSNRLSKVQADNQIRFQQLEDGKAITEIDIDNQNKIVSSTTESQEEVLC